MNAVEFEKENSALLIIDMQNAFVHPEGSLASMGLDTSKTRKVVEPIRQLREAFKAKKRPVIYIQHTHQTHSDSGLVAKVFPSIMDIEHCVEGTWDSEIVNDLTPDTSDFIITKHQGDDLHLKQLTRLLQQLGIENLVVTGVSTNFYLESTVKGAFTQDLNVFVPEEAATSYRLEKGVTRNFDLGYAQVVKVKDLLYDMLMLVI